MNLVIMSAGNKIAGSDLGGREKTHFLKILQIATRLEMSYSKHV